MLEKLEVKTHKQVELIDITRQVKETVGRAGVKNGVCVVFVPHTTAGITINENADPDVVRDIIDSMNKIVPFDDKYRHIEGNSPGHIKSSLFSASLTIIVENDVPLLGTWQGIYFCEFDGPRTRKLFVKTIEG
ncbi:MAG: secondary thiamine-phosphate synthase enzyme YjbQ [Promethearchaeota archaeon]